MQVEGRGAAPARLLAPLRDPGGTNQGGANAGGHAQPFGPPSAALVAAPACAPFLPVPPPPNGARDALAAVRISRRANELSKSGQRLQADELLCRGIREFPTNTVLWNQRIALRSRDGLSALAMAEAMGRAGAPADQFTFNILISVMGWARQPGECWTVYQRMVAIHIAPDSVTYGTLIAAFGRAHMVHDLRTVFLIMRASRVGGDTASYSTLIAALVAGDRLVWAWEAFEAMQADGVLGTATLFRTLVEGCCRAGQPERAWQAVVVMQRTEAVPGYEFLGYLGGMVVDALVSGGAQQRGLAVAENLRAYLAAAAPHTAAAVQLPSERGLGWRPPPASAAGPAASRLGPGHPRARARR